MTSRVRPNVVLLMADQQKATSLRLYGNPDTRTPTLDALAARGVSARHHFVTHPFCFPSRCSLMTGRYPQGHGVRDNGMHLPAAELPLAEILRREGYRTGAFGHFGGGASGGASGGDRGFDVAIELGEGRQRDVRRLHHELIQAAPRPTAHMTATLPRAAHDDVDAVVTDDALRFLDGVPPAEPFFLHVAWIAPHPPYFLAPPYDTRYDPDRLTYPIQNPPDARKPAAHRQTAIDMGTWDAPEAELRRALAYYYGMVNVLDDQVARVLDHLERRGRLRDTVVIYTSDHGDYAGEHGMWGKSATLYDALVRVPLIVAGPDGLLPAGRAIEGMTQSIDVLPTLLTLLGQPVPENVHGLPLQPLWGGPPVAPWDGPGRTGFDVAFAQAGSFSPARARTSNVPAGPPASGRHQQIAAMARTAEWKLVYTPGRETQELYDLAADPWERQNRYGDPALAPVERALRQRILDWILWHT